MISSSERVATMSLNGGWVSYGGDAKIELAVGLVAVAGCAAYAGIRLRRPIRAVRPPASVVVLMFSLWAIALFAFLVGLAVYVKQYVHDFPHIGSAVHDPITPVTLLAAVALFGIIMTRTGWRFPTRLGSAVVGAMAAPMIFELPFDLIVMARTYPALPPDPALYRAVFFTPLILVELTTLWLLTLSPLVRVRKSTLFCFALMIGVFGIWALSGFGYPQSALPITLNVVSKILAFITALTLFLPDRLRNWRTDGPPAAPGREQVRQLVMAGPVMASPAMAAAGHGGPGPDRPGRERAPRKREQWQHARQAPYPAREAIMGGPAIKVVGLRKSFGDEGGGGRDRPGDRGRLLRRAGRAERGREDHLAVDDDRPAAARRRADPDQRAGRVGRPAGRQGDHRRGAGRSPAVRPAQRRGTAGIRRAAARPAGRRGAVQGGRSSWTCWT